MASRGHQTIPSGSLPQRRGSVPIDYEAVLMDLKEMKVDVEAGIVAIERLIVWRAQGMNIPGERPRRSQKALVRAGYNSSDSLPVRVREFLNQNPGRAYTVPEIGEAI